MQRRIIFLGIFLIGNFVFGQNYLDLKSVSSSLKKSYQKALLLYQSNQYDKAQKSFEKIIVKEQNFIDAHLILASIHYDKTEYDLAIPYFQKTLSLNSEYNPKIYYTLALCQYQNRNYSEAFKNITEFLKREKNNEELITKAKAKLLNYRFADSATQHPLNIHPIPIPNINSEFSEYLPSLTADGRTMVFTRKIFNDNEDLFISYKKLDGSWSDPESITELNTIYLEGAPSISADGNTLIFTSCDRKDSWGGCDLYISHKKNNIWGPAVNLGDKINTPAYESQPCLADNGNSLFFCSNRVGGFGGKDIWMTYKNKSNAWVKPINLGENINTSLNEECPFLHQDGISLYYSSDGHVGMGGKDIFYSKSLGKFKWSESMNLSYPINSPLDESSFCVYYDGKKAMMASDKAFEHEKDRAKLKYINLDLYEFDLPESIQPISSCYLNLSVIDGKTKKPIAAFIEIFELEEKKLLISEQLNSTGKTLISIPGHQSYAINISHQDYAFLSENLVCNSNYAFNPENKIWELTPLVDLNKAIVLKNIFFESNASKILSESYFELDKLIQLLNQNKENDVLISGHTDNVGNKQENQTLSEQRALAVKDYLVSKGIEASRIATKGLGESNPIESNDTEEGRQKNRRTEFTLSKKR